MFVTIMIFVVTVLVVSLIIFSFLPHYLHSLIFLILDRRIKLNLLFCMRDLGVIDVHVFLINVMIQHAGSQTAFTETA